MTTTTPSPAAAAANNSTATTPATEQTNLLNTIHRLLGAKLHVTMTDGRIATGKFVSLDRLGNIVLEDVVERRRVAYAPPSSAEGGDTSNNDEGGNTSHDNKVYTWDTERTISQAVILGDRLAKVEIAKGEWDARFGRETSQV